MLSFLRPLITGNKAREILWYIFPRRPIPFRCLKRNWGAELQDRAPQSPEAPQAAAYTWSWQNWGHAGSSPSVCVPGGLSCAGLGHQPRAQLFQSLRRARARSAHPRCGGERELGTTHRGNPDSSRRWDLGPDLPCFFLGGCQNQQTGAGRGGDARQPLWGKLWHFKHRIMSDMFGWRQPPWPSSRWRRWPAGRWPQARLCYRVLMGQSPMSAAGAGCQLCGDEPSAPYSQTTTVWGHLARLVLKGEAGEGSSLILRLTGRSGLGRRKLLGADIHFKLIWFLY